MHKLLAHLINDSMVRVHTVRVVVERGASLLVMK